MSLRSPANSFFPLLDLQIYFQSYYSWAFKNNKPNVMSMT